MADIPDDERLAFITQTRQEREAWKASVVPAAYLVNGILLALGLNPADPAVDQVILAGPGQFARDWRVEPRTEKG